MLLAALTADLADSASLHKLESGATPLDLQTLIKIVDQWGVSADYLIGVADSVDYETVSSVHSGHARAAQLVVERNMRVLAEEIIQLQRTASAHQTEALSICKRASQLRDHFQKFRQMNPVFDSDFRGGAVMVAHVEAMAEHAAAVQDKLRRQDVMAALLSGAHDPRLVA